MQILKGKVEIYIKKEYLYKYRYKKERKNVYR